jgi:LPS sulfotransferase NodH
MHPFRALYGREHDFPIRKDRPAKSYFLAAIPRVGSTHLAVSLWRTGLLGAPMEYLNLKDRAGDVKKYGDGDLFRYWESVQSRRTSPNGVFGSKLFTNDFWEVFNLDKRALSMITADYVVQLRRRDRLQQAISYSRARLTRVWIPASEEDRRTEAEYDFDHICESLVAIGRQERSWEKIIERTEARAITLYYEDFDSDTDSAVKQVMDFLGVGEPGTPVENLPNMSRQRDNLSLQWLSRFNDDLESRGLTLHQIGGD